MFRKDLGGVTEAVGEGAEYTGKLAPLNKLGLRRGIQTEVTNLDEAGSWFARTDTAAHEGLHKWIAEHLPSVWRAGEASIGPVPIGAPIKYAEEFLAYNVGHGAALRVHGLGVAPVFEALGSLSARERVFVEALMVGGVALAMKDSKQPPQ